MYQSNALSQTHSIAKTLLSDLQSGRESPILSLCLAETLTSSEDLKENHHARSEYHCADCDVG